MPERYVEAILKYLAAKEYQPLTPRRLARQMGIAEEDYTTFREAVKVLRDSGQVTLGSKNALVLPEMSSRLVGTYRANPRGFGFVIPDSPNSHGDLFIPPDNHAGAMSGDHVEATVRRKGKRGGQKLYEGQIVNILRRGNTCVVGTLEHARKAWFVIPDGKGITPPVIINDIGEAGPKSGTKVVAEIVEYPEGGDLPVGVIVENLGEAGPLEVETLAIIRSHDLAEEFSEEALADARSAIGAFEPNEPEGRQDLTQEVIVTIDPPDARDFDDAISLKINNDGSQTLGVHIADVSHFVQEGTKLDEEARERGTSVYFPRKVLPMLPEILSNGVCSLQEGKRRFCKSVFITYDEAARVVSTQFAESIVSSSKRLTYAEAQHICDGKTGGFEHPVIELVQNMEKLARRIEKRRYEEGMLHLDLPDAELVLDEDHRVVDVVPEDNAYTHTIIEMFMVEANEAVAALLDYHNRPFLRRVHPDPDTPSRQQLTGFIRACGHKIPRNPSKKDIQALLRSVEGKPESYAVSLAILKMLEQAEYSPMNIGHYALASNNYCHFTSPIRRYPDLTVHRLIRDYCRNGFDERPAEDVPELVKLGEHCSSAERVADAAEDELRTVLLLQFLESRVGDDFTGVITGVTNFGIFVQLPRYLIDGLIRMEHLGDDWWELDAKRGQIVGERTGKKFRIGDLIEVTIAGVDVSSRQLDLSPKKTVSSKRGKSGKGKRKSAKGKSKVSSGRNRRRTRG